MHRLLASVSPLWSCSATDTLAFRLLLSSSPYLPAALLKFRRTRKRTQSDKSNLKPMPAEQDLEGPQRCNSLHHNTDHYAGDSARIPPFEY
jgi:hypothetical protein